MKLLIVEDEPPARELLRTLSARRSELELVGEAADGRTALEAIRELEPDVVLMDLRMPEMNGVEAMSHIRSENPNAKFIVLTTFDTDEYIFDAIDAGARGYLLKDASADELFHAVRNFPTRKKGPGP